ISTVIFSPTFFRASTGDSGFSSPAGAKLTAKRTRSGTPKQRDIGHLPGRVGRIVSINDMIMSGQRLLPISAAAAAARGLFLARQELNRLAQAAVAFEEALRQSVHQRQELEQLIDACEALLSGLAGGLGAEHFRRQFFAAAAQRIEDGIDLAALALAGDEGEHLPDV